MSVEDLQVETHGSGKAISNNMKYSIILARTQNNSCKSEIPKGEPGYIYLHSSGLCISF